MYSGRLVELIRRNDDFDQLNADIRVSREDKAEASFVASHSLLKFQGVAGIGQAGAQPGSRACSWAAPCYQRAPSPSADGRVRLSSDAHLLTEGSRLSDLAAVPAANFEQLGLQGGLRGLASIAGGRSPSAASRCAACC